MAQQFAIALMVVAAFALMLTGFYYRHSRRDSVKPSPEREFHPISKKRGWLISHSELNAYMMHDERRTSPRRCGAPTPIHFLEVGFRVEQEAYVLDRSEYGLRLAVLHNILPKHVIRIKADRAPPDTPWVEVIVCWCSTVEGGFDIGVKYKQPVTANIRLLFG